MPLLAARDSCVSATIESSRRPEAGMTAALKGSGPKTHELNFASPAHVWTEESFQGETLKDQNAEADALDDVLKDDSRPAMHSNSAVVHYRNWVISEPRLSHVVASSLVTSGGRRVLRRQRAARLERRARRVPATTCLPDAPARVPTHDTKPCWQTDPCNSV